MKLTSIFLILMVSLPFFGQTKTFIDNSALTNEEGRRHIVESDSAGNVYKSFRESGSATIQTIGNTSAVMAQISVEPDERVYISFRVIGRSGNNVISGTKIAVLKNVAGTVSVVGSAVNSVVNTVSDPVLNAANFTVTNAGEIEVAGVTNQTIEWICYYEIFRF